MASVFFAPIARGSRKLDAVEGRTGTLGTLATAAAVTLAGVRPQLAATADQLYLTFGRGDTVYVARSSDRGQSFGVPVVLPITGEVSLGMGRGPSVAVTNNAPSWCWTRVWPPMHEPPRDE